MNVPDLTALREWLAVMDAADAGEVGDLVGRMSAIVNIKWVTGATISPKYVEATLANGAILRYYP